MKRLLNVLINCDMSSSGENRARYIQLLQHGLYTPWTLPVGSSEQALQGLVDSLLVNVDGNILVITNSSFTKQLLEHCVFLRILFLLLCFLCIVHLFQESAAAHRQGSVSSPISIATPLSLDTAYSSILQDTPCSFGITPRSQGTPRTPCFLATPLSQDSCYSSLQATPVLQGEGFTHSVHKPLRRELSRRTLARCQRGSTEFADVSLFLKQTQPPHPLSTQLQSSSQQLALWGPPLNNTEPSFNLTSPCQESVLTATPNSKHLTCNTFSILSIQFTADRPAAASSSLNQARITELSPPAVNCSSSSPQPQVESLDSRIESLLINSHNTDTSYFDRETPQADAPSPDSPASPTLANTSPFSDDSLVCIPVSCPSFTNVHQQSCSDAADVDPVCLPENEEDETTRAVSFLTRNSLSPAASDFTHLESGADVINEKNTERFQPLSSPKVISLDFYARHDDS